MCGPSSEEKSLQRSSASFSDVLQQNYSTLFANQATVLSALRASLSPTLAAGPNQRGFSGEERAALDTQAINQSAAATRSAEQAARTFGAGQGGGGTSGVTSGIDKQIQAAIASQGAEALGSEENKIEQADFSVGRENYWRAQGGMDQLAAGYSPNAASSGAISSNKESFGQANEINKESMQETQMIAGGLTSLAGAFTGSDFAGQLGGGKIFGPGGFFG